MYRKGRPYQQKEVLEVKTKSNLVSLHKKLPDFSHVEFQKEEDITVGLFLEGKV
jgi:hypothetical protein